MATSISVSVDKRNELLNEGPSLIAEPKGIKRKSSKQPENQLDVCNNFAKDPVGAQRSPNRENRADVPPCQNQNDQINEKNESIDLPPVELTRKSRCWFFAYILLINYCVNLENGTIPASTVKIQEDLKCSERDLGLFGSLLYVGNIIGKLK